MKGVKTFLVLSVAVLIAMMGAVITPSVRAEYVPDLSSGSFVEEFDDGVISDFWRVLEIGDSTITEADGVLNINIVGGMPEDGVNINQFADIGTKEEFLKGDFDVQAEFTLNPDYFSQAHASSIMSLEVPRSAKDIDHIDINIVSVGDNQGFYVAGESYETESGGGGETKGVALATDLDGKLRITRQGNIITTYFWRNGWVELAKWPGKRIKLSDTLGIGFVAYNGEPLYPAFWVKWDDLRAYWRKK